MKTKSTTYKCVPYYSGPQCEKCYKVDDTVRVLSNNKRTLQFLCSNCLPTLLHKSQEIFEISDLSK